MSSQLARPVPVVVRLLPLETDPRGLETTVSPSLSGLSSSDRLTILPEEHIQGLGEPEAYAPFNKQGYRLDMRRGLSEPAALSPAPRAASRIRLGRSWSAGRTPRVRQNGADLHGEGGPLYRSAEKWGAAALGVVWEDRAGVLAKT